MQKLFILALVAVISISASAQRTTDRGYGSDRYHHRNDYPIKRESLQRRIDAINRNYDMQISYVKHNPHLRKRDKKKQVKQLERERKVAIDRAKLQYSRRNFDRYSFRER